MSFPTCPRIESDLARLRAAQHKSQKVLLTGETGVGKRTLMRHYAQELTAAQTPHVLIDHRTDQVPTITAHTVVLAANINRIHPEILQSMLTGHPGLTVVASLSDNAPGTHHSEIHETVAQFVQRAHTLHIDLYSSEDLARLLHLISPLPLDVTTLNKLIELSWGRPSWATHLINSITEAPEIRSLIRKPVVASVIARYFSDATSGAQPHSGTLAPETIAYAILLAEIGPRSYTGVVDLIGFAATHQLVSAGFLAPAPGSDDRWGVPLLFTPNLIARADETTLNAGYQRIASQLLSQDELGLPLSEAEERVTVFALMSQRTQTGDDSVAHPNATDLILRRMQRQICFGAKDPAKDLMLRLQRQGTAVCDLTRAKLISLLHDSHAAFQSLLFEDQHSGNCALPLSSRPYRLGLLCLRAQLSASSGGSYRADDSVRTGEPEWSDALTVLQAWNRSDALDADLPKLTRIAKQHPQPEIQLLAEQLCAIESLSQGHPVIPLNDAPFGQRLTHAFRSLAEEAGATAKLDDLYITLVVASQLHGLYDPSADADLSLTTRFVQRLSGDIEHTIWSAHLAAAKEALHCGEIERFELELQRYKAALPRFIPVRLVDYIDEFLRACADGQVRLSHTFASQLVSYFAGKHLDVTRLPQVPHTERAEKLAQAPALNVMGAHVVAFREQNPAALRRVARRFAQLGLWYPAGSALEGALKIYTSRRASGKCSEVEAEMTEVHRAARSRVLWLAPRTDTVETVARLTRREIQTAQRVAEGLSNLEIAEVMQCSVRTVESHVSNARAKLGAKNRAELARRISQHPNRK